MVSAPFTSSGKTITLPPLFQSGDYGQTTDVPPIPFPSQKLADDPELAKVPIPLPAAIALRGGHVIQAKPITALP